MAERLKEQILEKKKAVDIVCGPDAYKDLPRLLSITTSGQTAGTIQRIVFCLFVTGWWISVLNYLYNTLPPH